MDCRYATFSPTPWTSRNCSASAPGTTPAFQFLPPSVVTTNVPPRPDAQTTRGFTGLTAISPRGGAAILWGQFGLVNSRGLLRRAEGCKREGGKQHNQQRGFRHGSVSRGNSWRGARV